MQVIYSGVLGAIPLQTFCVDDFGNRRAVCTEFGLSVFNALEETTMASDADYAITNLATAAHMCRDLSDE
jgi:hypothetical protein